MKTDLIFAALTARLREYIESCSYGTSAATTLHSDASSRTGEIPPSRQERQFNPLALESFALQFEHVPPYRRLCRSRKVAPDTVSNWTQIPAVPSAAFKDLELTSLAPDQRMLAFHTSGTTAQRPGRCFHSAESLALYEASLLPWFAKHLLAEQNLERDNSGENRPMSRPRTAAAFCIVLTPPPAVAPHSSLVHMFETIRRAYGSADSFFGADLDGRGGWMLDLERIVAALRKAGGAGEPVVILGAVFSFVQLLDHLAAGKIRLRLPAGSRVLETGGYKGRSRSLPKPELHRLILEHLDISPTRVVSEYGMTELSSQAYDRVAATSPPISVPSARSSPITDLRSSITPDASPLAERLLRFPPWAKSRIVSPETGEEVADGETGLIQVFDLANVRSVMGVQTEDVGIRRGDGFEWIGRASLAEPRGCSLMSA